MEKPNAKELRIARELARAANTLGSTPEAEDAYQMVRACNGQVHYREGAERALRRIRAALSAASTAGRRDDHTD